MSWGQTGAAGAAAAADAEATAAASAPAAELVVGVPSLPALCLPPIMKKPAAATAAAPKTPAITSPVLPPDVAALPVVTVDGLLVLLTPGCAVTAPGPVGASCVANAA